MASRLEECHFFLEECHSGVAGFVSGLQRAKPALPLYWLYSNAARPPVGTPQQAHAYVDDRGRRRRSSSFINKHDLGPHTSIPQSAHDQGNVFKRSSQSFEAHQQSKKKIESDPIHDADWIGGDSTTPITHLGETRLLVRIVCCFDSDTDTKIMTSRRSLINLSSSPPPSPPPPCHVRMICGKDKLSAEWRGMMRSQC
jgi:hypothetical protein